MVLGTFAETKVPRPTGAETRSQIKAQKGDTEETASGLKENYWGMMDDEKRLLRWLVIHIIIRTIIGQFIEFGIQLRRQATLLHHRLLGGGALLFRLDLIQL